MKKEVTLIITSCNRLDLLEKTLISFNKFNTYPIKEYIIRDDSNLITPEEISHLIIKNNLRITTFVLKGSKIGQAKSIDILMSHVKTPYVFHCEDDWGFTKEGFIEKSMTILEAKPKIMQVWIRPKSDGVGHNFEEEIHEVNGVKYRLVELQRGMSGFSFNPHLARMSDYDKPYTEIGKECEIGQYYVDKGFRTAWLTDGYVKHIGGGRTCTSNQNWRG